MFEDDLRATFARHEDLTPAAGPLRSAINRAAVRRRRRRLVVRAAGAALAVLAAVSIPTAARDLAGSPSAPAAPPAPTSAVPDGPLNFLLLGVDFRADWDSGARADTIMIVHIPRDRSAVYLISIPRDLSVEVPGQGREKINAAFYFGSERPGGTPDVAGGARLMQRTLTGVTGLRFDGTVTLTFAALRRLTDAVGGVRMCLDHPVTSAHTKRVFPTGCQQLDGRSAIDLLRQRYYLRNGGHDRDRNGRRFVQALLAKVATEETLTSPVKVAGLLRAAGDGLTLDTGGLPLADLLATVREMSAADPVGIGWSFQSTETDDTGGMRLDAELSASLFDAARRDALHEWVANHPQQVSR
jgi:LCP family protein required for cell wall assembly